MAEDSAPVPLDHKRRLRVDPSVNIPTLVTLLSLFGALAVAYSSSNEKHASSAVQLQALEKSAQVDKSNIDRTLSRIEEEMRDLRRAVESINRRDSREPRR